MSRDQGATNLSSRTQRGCTFLPLFVVIPRTSQLVSEPETGVEFRIRHVRVFFHTEWARRPDNRAMLVSLDNDANSNSGSDHLGARATAW